MGSSSQPFSLYGSQNQAQTLVDRLKNCSNDDGDCDSWESLLDSACTQLDTFDDNEFNEFQDLLIRFVFLDDEFKRNKETIKVCRGLLYHIISVVDITTVEDHLELLLRTCATLPLDLAIHIHPLMFKAVVDKLRSDKLKSDALFADQDFIRFSIVFAMELGSSSPDEDTIQSYGAFWKASFDTYASEHCDSFDLKVFFAFLASKPYLKVYLQKSNENRKTLYLCVLRIMEKKPSFISCKMGCLLLMYIWDMDFNEQDWKNVALYVRKLAACSIHASASIATRDLIARTVTTFLRHARAPREECILKLQNHLKLNGGEQASKKPDSNIQSAPPTSDDRLEQENEASRYVDVLQKLVEKMKSKGLRMTRDSDKQKLVTVVRDLKSFL